MAATIKKIDDKDVLFKSVSDFSKLCAFIFMNDKLCSFQRITNPKSGFGTHVDVNTLDLADQAIDWFYTQAEIYLNLRKGKKNKALIFFVNSIPYFFPNRLSFGKLCAQIVKERSVVLLNDVEGLQSYADQLETDENGDLVSTDVSDWNIDNFYTQWCIDMKVEKLRDDITDEEREASNENEEQLVN